MSKEWVVKYANEAGREEKYRPLDNYDLAITQAQLLQSPQQKYKIVSIVGPNGEIPWEQIKLKRS